MIEFGNASIIIALFLSALAVLLYILGIIKEDETYFQSGKITIILASLATIAASVHLYKLIFTHDYSTEYIALYSSNDLPTFYQISVFWAGGDGSLLFWTLLISIFTAIVVIREKKDELLCHAAPVMLAIQSYFLYLLYFHSNPFDKLDFMPLDGNGLNPLLQDPGMVFHPPTLFLGYAGFVIPFAFMIAGVFLRDGDWVFRIRRWTLFSWLFLTLGNLFGSYWAYTMLNWGGYWGWDPVENASFMPWITATAFFHSFMIQEKKQSMKIWNILLILATFELVILGTLLTRSGIIDSVHSFGQSDIAAYIIWFMVIILVGTLSLLAVRYNDLKSRRPFDSYISRESSFLANNWIFIGAAFAVVWGTLYPLVSDIFRGYRVMVGPKFFNEVTIPLSIALIVLMGICPLIGWRKASNKNLKNSYTYPLLVAVGTTVLSAIIGIRSIPALIVVLTCVFALSTHVLDTIRAVRRTIRIENVGTLSAIYHTINNNKRTYGGYIAHIGIILLMIGVAGSSLYQYEDTTTISVGDSFTLGDYTFKMNSVEQSTQSNRIATAGIFDVYKNNRYVGEVKPAMYYYPKQDQDVTKPYVKTFGLDDIYMAAQGISSDRETLKIKVIPLMNAIWYGSTLIMIGTILAMLEIVENRRLKLYEI